jgi:addiction module HigA family antidote
MASSRSYWKVADRVQSRPHRPPAHPGQVLRDEVLPALDVTISDAARQLRVTRQTLHRILSGRSGISPEMAVRLGKFCGNGAAEWLSMQHAYDLWHAERRMHDELKKIPANQIR